jgi:CBS-domain-containing membrane protein
MAGRAVRDVMTTDVLTVHPDASFKQVVRLLAEYGVDGAPVVDEDGTVLGVVSGSDLTCHDEQAPHWPPCSGGRPASASASPAAGRPAT